MGSLSGNYIVIGILALLAIVFVISIIKKAIKLVIFIILVVVAFSVYNVVANGVSPLDEIKGYGVDFKYASEIKDYSVKIKNSVDNLKTLVSSEKFNETTVKTIKVENENLHKIETQIKELKHTKRLNIFHDKYLNYLNNLVQVSDGSMQIAKVSENPNVTKAKEIVSKLGDGLNLISGLK